ncbi:MAG: hypothetical protein WD042_01580 [Phycisphaeraceae bacterium]
MTVQRTSPVSNTERQRQFRARNPGYYGRLHAKRRAVIQARVAQMIALRQAMAVERVPLALPAPAVMIELPLMARVPAELVAAPPAAPKHMTFPPRADESLGA